MQIELEAEIVDLLTKLRRQAAARRMSFDVYLAQFVDSEAQAAVNGAMSLDEFDRVLDDLCAKPTAPLPSDFSRADIYVDHD